jgi:hypothetical protein
VILGRSYFNYVCNKDGGIHIYDTVELGSEYWDKDGKPRFYTEDRGAFDSSVFEEITIKVSENLKASQVFKHAGEEDRFILAR